MATQTHKTSLLFNFDFYSTVYKRFISGRLRKASWKTSESYSSWRDLNKKEREMIILW